MFLFTGTGTVMITITDDNDNPPTLGHKNWHIAIDETPGGEQPPDNSTIFTMAVNDRDISNQFVYKVR